MKHEIISLLLLGGVVALTATEASAAVCATGVIPGRLCRGTRGRGGSSSCSRAACGGDPALMTRRSTLSLKRLRAPPLF